MFRFKKALEIRNTKKSVLVAAVAAVVVGATGTTAAAALQRQAPSGLGSQAVPGFYDRTWTFAGETSIDDGMLELGVDAIADLPSQYLGEGSTLVRRNAVLVIGPETRIVDTRGRAFPRLALDEATVRVTGTLLQVSLWRNDGDGDLAPTVRVDRILVLHRDYDD